MNESQADNIMIIGRAERIDLPKAGLSGVPAKIDTGADVSSIWASNISESQEGLTCTLFAEGSQYYSGEKLLFGPGEYIEMHVANSFGGREARYKVKLTVRVKGRLIKGSFTLADRSAKIYPILLGKSILRGRFVVDVKAGDPIRQAEKLSKQGLYKEAKEMGEVE